MRISSGGFPLGRLELHHLLAEDIAGEDGFTVNAGDRIDRRQSPLLARPRLAVAEGDLLDRLAVAGRFRLGFLSEGFGVTDAGRRGAHDGIADLDRPVAAGRGQRHRQEESPQLHFREHPCHEERGVER